jgi:menaquinone-dependent protoporphyrinogen oxidase
MSKKVLVAYASKYGATAEIADIIGEVLLQAGFDTDILPAHRAIDLTPYVAVVLGSAAYFGQWRKDAATFLKMNEKALTECPVWLFSSGPSGDGDLNEMMQGWRFPKGLQSIADNIHPRDMTIFRGWVNPKKLNPFEKWILNNVKSPIGDFRDWDAITSWSTAIANELKN